MARRWFALYHLRMGDTYRTPTAEHSHEIDKIKGSRFIAAVAPVASAAAAEAFIQERRERYPDSRHTCFAYRLDHQGNEFRYSDDGEPGSSAGRPILRQIEARDLTNTVVVVTRYFGGTKLGVGGLIRAYGAAAAAVLEQVAIREVVITRRVVVTYAYELSSAVNAVVAALRYEATSADYGGNVSQVFMVPPGQVDEFSRALRDRTGGQVEVVVEPE